MTIRSDPRPTNLILKTLDISRSDITRYHTQHRRKAGDPKSTDSFFHTAKTVINKRLFNTIWITFYGTNNCWFPLARKWPTWKWTWIWIPYMGRSKKMSALLQTGFTRKSTSSEHVSHRPLLHAAVNPCLEGESPWNWSCNSVNLRKSTVTWMRRHYVFTVISRWSTFSSTVNLCNINYVIFSDTHCSFGPPILWHSPFHAGVSVY